MIMKNLITKIFFFFCGAVFLFEGAIALTVRYTPFSVDEITEAYFYLLKKTWMINISSGVAVVFVLLGLVCLYRALRRNGRSDMITVNSKDGILTIPIKAIRDFIDQMLIILDQYASMSDFRTTIIKKGKWIHISISSTLTGAVPIRQEVQRIKAALKEQIARVFELTHFKIEFQVKGIHLVREEDAQHPQFPPGAGTAPGGMEGDAGELQDVEPGGRKDMPWE